jgi:hypothetical protein
MTDVPQTADSDPGRQVNRTTRSAYALCFFCFSIGLVTAPAFHAVIGAAYHRNWLEACTWAAMLAMLGTTLSYVVWRSLKQVVNEAS